MAVVPAGLMQKNRERLFGRRNGHTVQIQRWANLKITTPQLAQYRLLYPFTAVVQFLAGIEVGRLEIIRDHIGQYLVLIGLGKTGKRRRMGRYRVDPVAVQWPDRTDGLPEQLPIFGVESEPPLHERLAETEEFVAPEDMDDMLILVSNDDGYQAPGVLCLAEALRPLAEVIVVAPDRDRSGASNSLSLKNPLYVTRHDHEVYSVEGTPTDCVHVAITGLLEREPDMVVSGINAGPNMGDDVIYSGTVAAAMEGRFLGLPAIALSQDSYQPRYFATAARIAVWLIQRLQERPLPPDIILNVNVPDRPWEQLAGIQATRLGHRHKAEPVIKSVDPRGRPIYWIGPAGLEQDAGLGTDFHAVRTGHISITPLHVDLTRHRAIDPLTQWLDE